MTVQLSAPLASGSVHKGDSITAQVARPDAYRGDTIQGRVTQVNAGRGMFEFTVDALRHSSGVDVKVSAKIQGFSNSKDNPAWTSRGGPSMPATPPRRPPADQGRFAPRWTGRRTDRPDFSEAPPENSGGSPAGIAVAAPGGVQLAAGATMVAFSRVYWRRIPV